MTSFLYSPLMGFMLLCGIDRISDQIYAACSDIFSKTIIDLQKLFMRSKTVGMCDIDLYVFVLLDGKKV